MWIGNVDFFFLKFDFTSVNIHNMFKAIYLNIIVVLVFINDNNPYFM